MLFLDFIVIPLVLYAGHLMVDHTVNANNIRHERPLLLKLFYYHIFFSLVFGLYVTFYGGDAVGYWRSPGRFLPQGSSWLDLHSTGTPFMYFLTYPFSQVLGISFWSGTLLFSLLGFAGFLFIFLTLVKTMRVNPKIFGFRLFPLILFLPNMHFWSGGIGKDTVMFFSLTLFIFCLTNPIKNILGIIVSFYLAYYIRPHIALLMSIGFGFSLLISTKGVSFFWRVIFFGLTVYVFVLISPAVLDFIGLEEEGLESFEDVASIRSKNLSRSNVGSAIDIRNYSTPLKLFTFLFRPLFFDAGNLFGLIVSFENLFYLILMVMILRFSTLVELLRMPMHLKAGLFVLSSATFFMSSSLSNLGIIIRQKNMVMFMFVLIVTYLIGKAQKKGIENFRPIQPRRPIGHEKIKVA